MAWSPIVLTKMYRKCRAASCPIRLGARISWRNGDISLAATILLFTFRNCPSSYFGSDSLVAVLRFAIKHTCRMRFGTDIRKTGVPRGIHSALSGQESQPIV